MSLYLDDAGCVSSQRGRTSAAVPLASGRYGASSSVFSLTERFGIHRMAVRMRATGLIPVDRMLGVVRDELIVVAERHSRRVHKC